MAKKISLTRGRFVIVDDDDYQWLMHYKWHYQVGQNRKTGYAVRMCYKTGSRVAIRMHREILDFPASKHIDHINGSGLDNRKNNLRQCTSSENQKNGPLRSDNTSGFKGVSWSKYANAWRPRICIEGKRINLGSFKTSEAAARAYDEAARKHYGEFARLNFPEE